MVKISNVRSRYCTSRRQRKRRGLVGWGGWGLGMMTVRRRSAMDCAIGQHLLRPCHAVVGDIRAIELNGWEKIKSSMQFCRYHEIFSGVALNKFLHCHVAANNRLAIALNVDDMGPTRDDRVG